MTRSELKRVGRAEIEPLALGSAVLGSGGGGNPYLGSLILKTTMDRRGLDHVELVPHEQVDTDHFLICSAGMGSPVVGIEKIPGGHEYAAAYLRLERFLKKQDTVVSPVEIGGVNSIVPLVTAAHLGRRVADGDGEGRAFPELQMTTFNAHGVNATPMVIADERNNYSTIVAKDALWAEKIARAITLRFGGRGYIALYPMGGEEYRRAAIPGSLTYAHNIGQSLLEGIRKKDAEQALLDATGGTKIFTGKIVDLKRTNTKGFAVGETTIEGQEEYRDTTLKVVFQNEYLLALMLEGGDNQHAQKRPVAATPDIISIHDQTSYRPITTDQLKYGARCHVFRLPAPEKWLQPNARRLVEPAAFGLLDK